MKTLIVIIFAVLANINLKTEIDYQYDSINVIKNSTCISIINGTGDCFLSWGNVCDSPTGWLLNYEYEYDSEDDDGCTGTDVCAD